MVREQQLKPRAKLLLSGAIQTGVRSAAVVEDPAAARGQQEAAQHMPSASCFRTAGAGAPYSRGPFPALFGGSDQMRPKAR